MNDSVYAAMVTELAELEKAVGRYSIPQYLKLRYVLERGGQQYRGAPRPKGERQRSPHSCYISSLTYVTEHPTCAYVGGFTMEEDEHIPIADAWCTTESGDVIDLVLGDPEKARYHGIAFSNKEVKQASRKKSANRLAKRGDVLLYFALKAAQKWSLEQPSVGPIAKLHPEDDG